jgi:MFS family permease
LNFIYRNIDNVIKVFLQSEIFTNDRKTTSSGLIYLLSAFLAPLFGYVIDRVGRNISFVFSAVIVTLVGHCILGFTSINPYFGIVPMGIGYSLLAAALWPIVALIVPLHRQGTAFGEFGLILFSFFLVFLK